MDLSFAFATRLAEAASSTIGRVIDLDKYRPRMIVRKNMAHNNKKNAHWTFAISASISEPFLVSNNAPLTTRTSCMGKATPSTSAPDGVRQLMLTFLPIIAFFKAGI